MSARWVYALASGLVMALVGCTGRTQFSMEPVVFSECVGPNIVAHLRWDASAATSKPVSIYVYKIGKQPTLFAKMPVKGKIDTGAWIADGSTVMLATDTGKVLAKRTMQTTVCQSTER